MKRFKFDEVPSGSWKKYKKKDPHKVTALQIDEEFRLDMGIMQQAGKPGDYIMIDTDGELELMPKDLFERDYEPLIDYDTHSGVKLNTDGEF